MPKQAAHGRFVWHDLAVPNPDAALSFYPEITPWKTEKSDDSATYTLLKNDGALVGGVAPLAKDAVSRGVGPSWMPYVSVYDVDACVRQVTALGGQLRMGPKEVPHVGCWAVIVDPQGAALGMFEPAEPAASRGAPGIGEFSWHELATTDLQAATEFYRALFHWEQVSDYDMGPMGTYRLFGQRGETYGGMFNRTPDMPQPNWLSYVRVRDVKITAERVSGLGGQVINGPMEVPGGDWIAQCIDPQGAMFALHTK